MGNVVQVPYAVGEAILGVVAFFVRDYVSLQWVMSLAMLLMQVGRAARCWTVLIPDPRVAAAARVPALAAEQGAGGRGKGTHDQGGQNERQAGGSQQACHQKKN